MVEILVFGSGRLKPCPNDARRNLLSNGQVESSRRAWRLELWQFVSLTSVFLRFFLSHVRFRYCGSLKLQECAICHNNNKSACSGTPCGSSYGMFSDSISINYIKFPRLSQDTYLKKMRSAICYKMNVSRASGAACGSSYGRFCIFIWGENVSTADSDRGRLILSFGWKKRNDV